MNSTHKTRITQCLGVQTAILGFVLLALHFPASAQTAGLQPITFDQTVQGTLTSTDRLLQDGTPYDTYVFTVTAPGQPYFIQAHSPDIPLTIALFRLVPGGGFIDQQAAFVSTRGQTVGLFGALNQPGRYALDVSSADEQQPTGLSGTARYTLILTSVPPPASPYALPQ